MPSLIVRMLALWALAIWLGGFTFYSAVVIPVLHDRLESSLETGLITQRVTDVLNILGVATISLGWVATFLKDASRQSTTVRRRWSTGALALTTACLAILFALHPLLDRKLETAAMENFYPLHRVYLWASTVQWLANLTLLTCWAGPKVCQFGEVGGENPQVFAEMPKPKIRA